MGIFGIFGGSKKTVLVNQPDVITTGKSLEKILSDSDKAIADMQRADDAYRKDNDIEKRIKVYEKYLLEKPLWNSFNFSLSLANMYFQAGCKDQAWGYLNRMYMWAIDPTAIGGDISKIRLEQFKILKAEKKYFDALVMLVSSYVVNAYSIREMYFNKNKFKREAKTTAKALGLSERDLDVFADDLEKAIKKRAIEEKTVQKYCVDHIDVI